MADALDSDSSEDYFLQVQVLFSAPDKYYPNQQRQILPVGDGFGFILFLDYDYFPNGVQIKSTSKPRGPRKKKN